MIAERENTKVNFQRESRLLIAAKVRAFSSEGWKVVVTDGEGRMCDVAELDKLLPAATAPALTPPPLPEEAAAA
jgi:hypothetical protein